MRIRRELQDALEAAVADLNADAGKATISRPTTPAIAADWSTSTALSLAKDLGRPPREVASALVEGMSERLGPGYALEVAGPGFINVSVDPELQQSVVSEILRGDGSWAKPDVGKGKRVLLEFVSANPTGPLHVGNGWWASYGDALARLMRQVNYDVATEYYVNDAGNQIKTLGESILARKFGRDVPENGYRGSYINEIAERYDGPDDAIAAGGFAAEIILEGIKETLGRLNIHFDNWFSEKAMVEGGGVDAVLDRIRAAGLLEERGGAQWFASTRRGDSRDRVLVRGLEQGGTHTYLAGDLAYHYDKLVTRGYDHAIDVLGADHIGQIESMNAGMGVLGVDPERVEFQIGQMVSLASGKMSKRSGNYVPLDDFVDDLGPDSVRLLSLMGSVDQAQTIDPAALREANSENPVFYLQYAHTRMKSLRDKAAAAGMQIGDASSVALSPLTSPAELALIRSLEDLPDVLETAALERAPHRVSRWALDTASRFHKFYETSRVLGEPSHVARARLALVAATEGALGSALGVLGIEAPHSMLRVPGMELALEGEAQVGLDGHAPEGMGTTSHPRIAPGRARRRSRALPPPGGTQSQDAPGRDPQQPRGGLTNPDPMGGSGVLPGGTTGAAPPNAPGSPQQASHRDTTQARQQRGPFRL